METISMLMIWIFQAFLSLLRKLHNKTGKIINTKRYFLHFLARAVSDRRDY